MQLSTHQSTVSALHPDWSREQLTRWWEPNTQLVRSIRRYQKNEKTGGILTKFFRVFNVIQYRFWAIVTGTDIPLNAQIGGGLRLPHPNGIVIHPNATIGVNCMIFQQVTIVSDVQIGGHVDIGAGAKIVAPVKIGDHAKIGANAIVLCDVPPGATAVGVPARIIPTALSTYDPSPHCSDLVLNSKNQQN